ncbi:MAG TPA: nuclear transport factor 2 family protein [Candidatus Acidoferrales bacterium]
MSSATQKMQNPQDNAEILAIIESVQKAHHDKNAAAIVAAYTADADIYNLAPPLRHRGVDLKEKQAWLDTWDGPVELEIRDFKTVVSGDLAFGNGYYRMSGTKVGGPKVNFWMRTTVHLHRENGAWRITHEHNSVPFYMDDTLRPAFDLQPE